MDAVTFEDVCFQYETGAKVLDGLTFSVEKGSFTALLGRNGSGKSTAAKMINCLLLPKSGKVTVLGKDTADKNARFEIRKSAGMVFQNPDNQTVATMVEDDVAFGPENVGVPREEIGRRIENALTSVGMESFRSSTVSRLSGGQKQRVAIAGVLALEPEILILDEATAMLDPKGRKEVVAAARKLNRERGMTVVLITHYMEEAVFADQIVVLSAGKVALSGTPEEVFSRREEVKAAGLRLPRATDYAEKLKKAGVPVDADKILTEENLAEALCALFPNN